VALRLLAYGFAPEMITGVSAPKHCAKPDALCLPLAKTICIAHNGLCTGDNHSVFFNKTFFNESTTKQISGRGKKTQPKGNESHPRRYARLVCDMYIIEPLGLLSRNELLLGRLPHAYQL